MPLATFTRGTHNPSCSGCPVCKPEAFANAERYMKSSEPPSPYAEATDKAPVTPEPDWDPDYDPEHSRRPPNSYDIAIAVQQVEAEMKKEKP